MNKIVMTFILVVGYSIVYSQYESSVFVPEEIEPVTNDVSYKLSQSISDTSMEKILSVLASDEMEGRETGTEGNNKAAKYIKSYFEEIGLSPIEGSHFQKVFLNWESWDTIAMSVNEKEYKFMKDFISFPTFNSNSKSVDISKLYFLGYGIDDSNYSDYKKYKNRLKDKSILIYSGEPTDTKGESRITNSNTLSEWSQNLELKLKAAAKYGVANVIIISNDIQADIAKSRNRLLQPSLSIGDIDKKTILPNNVIISSKMARSILGKKLSKVVSSRDKIVKKGKLRRVKIKSDLNTFYSKKVKTVLTQNVVGMIEGSEHKGEILALTAHYDHLGKRGNSIYNGADDNGSGTTTLMEIAKAFMAAYKKGEKPKRTILFLLVSGEEKGLLGSKYYVNFPLFPLDNTIVNINMDMLGRVDNKYKDNPNYVYVIGSDRLSKELHSLNEYINQRYQQLIMDYTYNDANDPNRYYFRSDHYNFAEKGIPAIFFFNGTHADYHQPSDTVEKINFVKMSNIAKHIFNLTWGIANMKNTLMVDPY